HLNIDTALANARAAHAGEVGFAADFQGEAAVHDVIPAIPLRNARRVHRADEIAVPLRNRDENLLGANAVQLRNSQVWQTHQGPRVTGDQLSLAEETVPVGVDIGEVFGQ